MKSLMIALHLTLLPIAVLAQGSQTGGGDQCKKEIDQHRKQIQEWIERDDASDLDFSKTKVSGLYYDIYKRRMLEVLTEGKVIVTCYLDPARISDPVARQIAEREGVSYKAIVVSDPRFGNAPQPSTCINYEDENGVSHIDCNYDLVMNENSRGNPNYINTHHEYASIAGLEERTSAPSDMSLSSQLNEFEDYKITKFLGKRKKHAHDPQPKSDICWSAADATLENFYTCDRAVLKAIFANCRPITLAQLEGTAYRFDIQYSDPGASYAYIKDGKAIQTHIGTDGRGNSTDYGLFGILHLGKGTTKISPYNLNQTNVCLWKGALLTNWVGGIQLYHPIFPESPENLLSVIHSTNDIRYRVDALAAYLPLLTKKEQVLFLMDFIMNPEISGSNEVVGLAQHLASFKDQRTSYTFIELLQDTRIKADDKVKILTAALSSEILSPKMISFVIDILMNTLNGVVPADYDSRLEATILNFIHVYPGPQTEKAVLKVLSECRTNLALLEAAMLAARNLKLRSALTPTLQLLEFIASTNQSWADKALALHALIFAGEIPDPRALGILKNPIYFNSQAPAVIKAARESIALIQANQQLAGIKTGSASAIQWGMDLITYHNGAKRDLQMKVLDAFEIAMKAFPQTKKTIQPYLIQELAEGYHIQDQELTDRMKALSVL